MKILLNDKFKTEQSILATIIDRGTEFVSGLAGKVVKISKKDVTIENQFKNCYIISKIDFKKFNKL